MRQRRSSSARAAGPSSGGARIALLGCKSALLLLLAARLAYAEPLTIDQVLTEVRAHRQELQAARARAEAAAQTPKVVSALSEPMVMGGVEHLPFSLMGADYSVQLQQDFPLSGLLGARGRAAARQADAARARVGTMALDVEAAALRSFLMLVEAQRMKAVAAELRALAVQVHGAVEARLAATQASLSEAVRAEVEVARLDAELRALERAALGAWAMTQAAMGRMPSDVPAPECLLETPIGPPPDAAELVERAVDHRPELSAMKAELAASRANVDVMSSMYFPMAFVRVGFARTMSDGPGLMVMGGVSLPLWRTRLGAGYAEASAMSRMAEADLQAMRTMVQGEVRATRERVEAARARYLAVRDRVLPLSRQAVKLALPAYLTGQLPLVSVLDAARAQGEAQMELVRAEIDLDAAWIDLGRATGETRLGP